MSGQEARACVTDVEAQASKTSEPMRAKGMKGMKGMKGVMEFASRDESEDLGQDSGWNRGARRGPKVVLRRVQRGSCERGALVSPGFADSETSHVAFRLIVLANHEARRYLRASAS